MKHSDQASFDQSRRITKSMALRLALVVFACVVTTSANAQTLETGSSQAVTIEGRIDSEPDCGCRNVPGGYPCKSGCAKCMMGVDCANHCGAEARWRDMCPMDFGAYGPGGYAGPSRYAHLGVYRLRPGDQLQVFYLITRRQNQGEYRLAPGDEVLIESVADEDLQRGTLDRGLVIQPDGTITVRLLGQIHAAGLTVSQLRDVLEQKYKKLYDEPSIDVTPVVVNKLAEDIRNAVGGASGLQQQALTVTVMPDGKIRLPGIGGICVQGFSLPELKKEINLRYQEIVIGLEAEPILTQQAAHFVYVLGNVASPSRIQLTTPTTVLGAIAQAGGNTPDGNMRQVVILRRAEDWRLVSTMLDLQGAIYGKRPNPSDEIWLRDGDVVIVPARPIVRLDNWIDQVFTRGLYGVLPVSFDGD
ncbi:polysaccharide biosynthesis/export family protein [Stieleria sp. JC731]|uniref:polysaccharide biosynthesis/export family protein n=1 Tax=Pirellulaceae TaxID=2691357 RepID=UPI001E5CAC89|nr:polysaccharide biosynthesis/export family protein [Stieleria sp. JC731]MCC9601285.1 polysaccharide biosynthesis/export family protein [Stieleria sp. JC731]